MRRRNAATAPEQGPQGSGLLCQGLGRRNQEFHRWKDAVNVNYLAVTPERFLARASTPDDAVARYYQEHGEEFRLPDRARVNYLLFRSKDYHDRVKPTPTAVADYLSEHRKEYTRPKVIQARQILLISPQGHDAQRHRRPKRPRKCWARQGRGDFAALARLTPRMPPAGKRAGTWAWSTGARIPRNGIRLPCPETGNHGFGRHRQGDLPDQAGGDQETELLPEPPSRWSRSQGGTGPQLTKRGPAGPGGLVPGFGGRVGQKFGVTAKETPLFALSGTVPGLGVQAPFNQAALSLKPQEISKVVELPEGFAVLKGVEHQAAHLPPLAQIKDQVKAALSQRLARKQAEQEATRLLGELRQGKPLAQAAAAAGLPVKDSGFFTRFQGFLGQREAESMISAAFQLSRQHPYPEKPLWFQNQYYLLAFKARREPSAQEFQQERDRMRAEFLDQKQQLLFASWMDGERRRAKIEILSGLEMSRFPQTGSEP